MPVREIGHRQSPKDNNRDNNRDTHNMLGCSGKGKLASATEKIGSALPASAGIKPSGHTKVRHSMNERAISGSRPRPVLGAPDLS